MICLICKHGETRPGQVTSAEVTREVLEVAERMMAQPGDFAIGTFAAMEPVVATRKIA